MANINILALILAVFGSTAVGMLWYSPTMFGTQWMQMMGFTKKKMDSMKKDMTKTYLISFIGSMVQAYVLANLIAAQNPASINAGLTVGFIVWLGFIAITQLGSILWDDKPFSLFFLSAGQSLAAILVMSGILTWFML